MGAWRAIEGSTTKQRRGYRHSESDRRCQGATTTLYKERQGNALSPSVIITKRCHPDRALTKTTPMLHIVLTCDNTICSDTTGSTGAGRSRGPPGSSTFALRRSLPSPLGNMTCPWLFMMAHKLPNFRASGSRPVMPEHIIPTPPAALPPTIAAVSAMGQTSAQFPNATQFNGPKNTDAAQGVTNEDMH